MSEQHRPNVVMILADQLSRQTLGTYGDPNVSTPNIDALASSGTRFDAAYSTYPICVPTRFSIMTGEHPHSRFVPSIEWRMSPAERTLAHEFNDAEYDTAYVGKWHLYGGHGLLPGHTTTKANRTPVPRDYQGGWQKWLAFELCNDLMDTCYFVDDDPTPRQLGRYQTDGLFDLTIEHLSRRPDADRPNLTILSVEAPHPVFLAPDDYMERWHDRDVTLRPNFEMPESYRPRGPRSADLLDDMRAYYAMIENLDDNIGRLVEFLRAGDASRDTVVVLTADHGELLGSHGLVSKQYPYEESAGVPFIINDPRTSRPGRVIEEPVCTEDIFPTLLGLAGLPVPTDKPGTDLTGLVHGTEVALDRDGVLLEFVAEFRGHMPFHDETWRAFRSGRYKYTVLGGRPWQLFDMHSDPYELANRVDDPEYRAALVEHHGLLRKTLLATGDHYVLEPALGHAGLNDWSWPPGEPVRVG